MGNGDLGGAPGSVNLRRQVETALQGATVPSGSSRFLQVLPSSSGLLWIRSRLNKELKAFCGLSHKRLLVQQRAKSLSGRTDRLLW